MKGRGGLNYAGTHACMLAFLLLIQPFFVVARAGPQQSEQADPPAQPGKYNKSLDRGQPSAAVLPYWHPFQAAALGELRAFWHDRLGTPKSLYGRMVDVSKYMADPESAARLFLREHAGLFQLRSLQELRVLKQDESPGGTHLYFDQVYQGIRVHGARVSVHINPQGIITTVTNGYYPDVQLSTVRPSISSETVFQQMFNELASSTGRVILDRDPSRELVIYPVESGVYLAWRIMIPAQEPLGTWEAFYDALTGNRLGPIVDKNYYIDGTGRVFIPNPVVALNDTSIRDNGDSNSAAPESAYSTVTLFDLDGSGFLNGPYVNTGPTPSRVSRASHNFSDIHRGDNGFEEVETYWALDTAKRYFDTLGFPSVMNYSIGVNATGSNDCNAFYSGFGNGMGSITLHSPSNAPDAGEDADVTWHEYGHAIMDNQIPNMAQNFDGQGEGFGDYLAAAMSHREGPAGTHSIYDPCLGEWFSQCFTSAEPACLRRMDNSTAVAHWPEHRSGDPHFTGEIWSAALYDLQNMLGRDTTVTLALESNFRLPDAPSMPESAEALSQADDDVYGNSHQAPINSVFTSRGLFPQPYRITSPTAGDVLVIGTVHTITWTTSRSTPTVNLMISRTGGDAGTFTKFATVPNTGSFNWTVTGPETTEAVIRIREQSNGDTYRDHSIGVFIISSGPPPTNSVTVVAPNGGENWQIGSNQTISWTTTGTIANVKIELSRTGVAGPYETIFASTLNDGSQPWTVTGGATTNAFVRISDVANAATSDTSNAAFTISAVAPNSVTVVVPNGGENWQIGTTQTITWTTTGSIANVKIELSRNGVGGPFEQLLASTLNDGSQPWTVTGAATSNAIIKISDAANPATSDSSNAVFTISPAPPGPSITVISPNGGENWPLGTTQTITWTSSGVSGNVKIRLSRDGGASYRAIINSTPNDGDAQWLVSGATSSQCRIQVVSEDGTVRDSSDANFTISAAAMARREQ
ncbi:MAG: M36 family metallopeptidase [Acidobacteria bacterium]|nr:M36 family metallopeptidase [Acidobacteriota bacterium]